MASGKKVELFELFYDLIFVYAVSIGALIGFGANLTLSLKMYRGRTAAGREPVERWNTTS
jgi:hypothetical protein